MRELNDIEKKCLSCMYGESKISGSIRCNHIEHPGIKGGCGTGWVDYCDHYSGVHGKPEPEGG